MARKLMIWDGLYWGIILVGTKPDRDMLLGEGWHSQRPRQYAGEPLRPLLFTTRAAAREWAKATNAMQTTFNDRFRVIRVRQTVAPQALHPDATLPKIQAPPTGKSGA